MRAAVASRRPTKKVNVKPDDKKTGYNSYRFIDKDPIIDVMRTAIAQSRSTYAHIERKSGVTSQTLRNWFEGSTKRPQFATVQAVAKSIGKQLQLVDVRPNSRVH